MPASVIGVRPAVSSMAMFSRAAFIAAQAMLAVPTLTCTITAGILRVTIAYPWAIETARFSCVASMGRGTAVPCCAACA